MAIDIRSAHSGDSARLHEIFRAAFGKEDESDLWSYLLAHESLLADGDVLLALKDDLPMAVTVLQRRTIRTRCGWVPGAIVNLVACDPAVQGQGFGGAALRGALARMSELGMALGILYGVAEYYPRFGFVPVLPSCRTEVTTGVLQSFGNEQLRPTSAGDLAALASLYADAYDRYPCTIRRDATAALWGVRVPEINSLLVLPDQKGYAFIRRAADQLYIYEAAAADVGAGRRLLAALGCEAAVLGLEKVLFGLPPDHLLTRLLGLVQYRQVRSAALHGMVCISDWSQVLPPGYTVSDDGLWFEGRLAVRADQRALTELVIGYRGLDDLSLMSGVTVAAAFRDLLCADFTPAFPKWSLDPFWEGA